MNLLEDICVSVILLAIVGVIVAWPLMLLIGAVHHDILFDVRPIGFIKTIPIALLVQIVFNSSTNNRID